MVLFRGRFPSLVLGRNMYFSVLLPRAQSLYQDVSTSMVLGGKKVLWFFHGVGDDADTVLLHTDMADLCDAHDLIVILPCMENGFTLDVSENLRYRSYLTEELFPYVTGIFGLSTQREQQLIGGISMGGYGACSIGLQMPERFGRIFCLSGALDLRMAARFSRACGIHLASELVERRATELHPDWDVYALLERLAGMASPPPLWLVCSEVDAVFKSNLLLAERGAALGLPVELHRAPGLHDWRFWRENLPAALDWAMQ